VKNETITIFCPSDSYSYEVVGIGKGTYDLDITNIKNGKMAVFNAISIPISPNAVHKYAIDWNALSRDENGVKVQIDSDGDGVFEEIITTGAKFVQKEANVQL
jgi:hypothetical protein